MKYSIVIYMFSVILVSHLNTVDHELKLKVQELRLYETVLMERVHAVKSITSSASTTNVKVYLFVCLFY